VIRLRRMIKIIRVVGKYRLDLLLDKHKLPLRARLLLAPAMLFGAAHEDRGERLRKSLEELGPIFVKFGQLLSTRPDLVPDDISSELSHCKIMFHPFPRRYLNKI